MRGDRTPALGTASGGTSGEGADSPFRWVRERCVHAQAPMECRTLPGAPACLRDAHRFRCQSSHPPSRSGKGVLQRSSERTGRSLRRLERPAPPRSVDCRTLVSHLVVDTRRSSSSLERCRNRVSPLVVDTRSSPSSLERCRNPSFPHLPPFFPPPLPLFCHPASLSRLKFFLGSARRTRNRGDRLERPVPPRTSEKTSPTFPYLWHSYAILIIQLRLPWLGHGLASFAAPPND